MWERISIDKFRNEYGYELYVEDQIENEYETGKFELNIWLAEGGYWETIEVYNTFDEAIIALEQYVKDNPNVY